ncbi:hypothetical protein F7725_025831 [Dissostichus mawsoni]|uniref:Uncharacterized protein n=1 Tax=Dissostichus mawsoni TaxID=36200 RepID=A0A7J5X5C7_DISMA|nr:hypothetical protein F7725_025831 [Dissostichus mawsoni]
MRLYFLLLRLYFLLMRLYFLLLHLHFLSLRLQREAAEFGGDVDIGGDFWKLDLLRRNFDLRQQEAERRQDGGDVDGSQTTESVQLRDGNSCRETFKAVKKPLNTSVGGQRPLLVG